MDNKELLAALEITSEEEQKYWLLENDIIDLETFISLDDLAVRLTKEASQSGSYQWNCAKVYNYYHGVKLGKAQTHAPTTMMWIWYATQAPSICKIIAALITKK